MLGLSFIVVVLLNVLMVGNEALGATVYLNDIDSGLTSPTGSYRGLAVDDYGFALDASNLGHPRLSLK